MMLLARTFAVLVLSIVVAASTASKFDSKNDMHTRTLIGNFVEGVLIARDFVTTYTPPPLARRKCGWGGGKDKGKASDCTKEQFKHECAANCNFMSRATGRGAGGAEVGCHLACLTMKGKGTKG